MRRAEESATQKESECSHLQPPSRIREDGMATDTAPAEVPAMVQSRPQSKLVLIVGILVVIIIAQVVITWLLMPKSPVVAVAAEGAAKPDEPATAAADADDTTAESPLGSFNCTNTSTPGSTVQIDFKLSAITPKDKVSRLKERVDSHESRLRQTVAKVVRSAKLEDLSEPSLATLRRALKEEVNRLLRTNIEDVVITDFRHLEQ